MTNWYESAGHRALDAAINEAVGRDSSQYGLVDPEITAWVVVAAIDNGQGETLAIFNSGTKTGDQLREMLTRADAFFDKSDY